MSHFEEAFKFTVLNEGSISNHPSDRGGLTHYGITHGTASAHRCLIHPNGVNIKDVNLTLAKHIYLEDFWEYDGIKDVRIAVKLFDLGVNFGIKTVNRLAQETANTFVTPKIKEDGILGRVSCDVINSIDPQKFLDQFEINCDDRYWDIIYNSLVKKFGKKAVDSTQAAFGRGWFRRSNKRYYAS